MGVEGWQGAEGIPSRGQTSMKPQGSERSQESDRTDCSQGYGATPGSAFVFTGAMGPSAPGSTLSLTMTPTQAQALTAGGGSPNPSTWPALHISQFCLCRINQPGSKIFKSVHICTGHVGLRKTTAVPQHQSKKSFIHISVAALSHLEMA